MQSNNGDLASASDFESTYLELSPCYTYHIQFKSFGLDVHISIMESSSSSGSDERGPHMLTIWVSPKRREYVYFVFGSTRIGDKGDSGDLTGDLPDDREEHHAGAIEIAHVVHTCDLSMADSCYEESDVGESSEYESNSDSDDMEVEVGLSTPVDVSVSQGQDVGQSSTQISHEDNTPQADEEAYFGTGFRGLKWSSCFMFSWNLKVAQEELANARVKFEYKDQEQQHPKLLD